jgi:hypothetical protein
MADEATIRTSLQINKPPYLDYQSRPTDFKADVTGTKGPTPGAITVSILGTDVDLSQLTTPGLCRIQNQDDVNFVEYGIRENTTGKFYPLGELLPGETYVLRLSRWLGLEETSPGTGTGTAIGADNKLHFRADTAACNVLIEAFEV